MNSETTDVIFRRWRSGNRAVFALFLGEVGNSSPLTTCLSYERDGQYKAATPKLTSESKLAPLSAPDVVALRKELEQRGYNLNVIYRFTVRHRMIRELKCKRLKP